ncbi:MAG: hypothetical protein F9K29_04035 [Hyphomicrobiaceae bacterium]|nr:MAG: hypothetical protein F9K29_04035 [Hyphomicrobiaceae bacterium]
MKITTLSLAALALAAAVVAMPLGAEAAHKRTTAAKTWDCEMFGWLDSSLCKKKVVKKAGKKKYAKRSKKKTAVKSATRMKKV